MHAAHAQLVAADFTAYNPANASSITPGLTALYSIPVDSLIPTQVNVGYAETDAKANGFNLITSQAALNTKLLGEIEPVVIGPNGQLYQTDGHHTFVALQQSIYGPSNPNVYVQVIANYSGDTQAQFVAAMAGATQLYPFNNGVQQTVSQVGSNLLSPVPTSLSGLTNDPYRGLENNVLGNPGNVGHDKTPGYADFMWADAYRSAAGTNGGSGLPYLTPADANKAAVWSTIGTNVANLPGYATPVLVNQMPGYILPTGGSINVTGQITNANLGTGAISGGTTGTLTAASMNGLNGYTATVGGQSIVVEPQVSGLLVQLGSNDGGTVTLSNTNNTYTGGTTITAGTLIVAGNGSLGAASTGAASTAGCIGANNYSSCIDNAVRATNGIVFESLSEGAGTLQIGTNASTSGTAMTLARNISIGQEVANINMNGNTVTLTGNLFTSNLNTSGAAPLSIDGKGTLILAPTSGGNPLFYGNLDVAKGTLQVSSDAAMGATTGPLIGQLELDNGTFKAGASFASVRDVFMHGSVSTYDTNGFSTSWAGGLTDVQRTLSVINSGTTAGKVTFNSLTIGASAGLLLTPGSGSGAAGDTTVAITNGITREGNATLFINPQSGTLGGKDIVTDGTGLANLKNGISPAWIILDNNGSAASSPYSFVTYGVNGYVAATVANANGASAVSSSTGSQLVIQGSSATLTGNNAAYALQLQASAALTQGNGQILTVGDGTDPAGLIMNSKASITGGSLAFGGSEALITVKGSTTNANTIASTITGTGGITLSGSGQLNLNTASTNSGAVVINSGQLVLGTTNAISASSGLTLEGTNSSAEPKNAILSLGASNQIAAINDVNNNSQIFLGLAGAAGGTAGQTGAGIVLTIGETTGVAANLNLSSAISSTISDSGATTGTTGAITKVGTGLLDLSGGGSGGVTLNAASTIAVNGGQFRLNTDTLANNNAISTVSGTEVQLLQGGTIAFGSNVTGGGLLHVESGNVQLTGTGNTYTGGTTLEIGTTLVASTATLSSAANQTITNAGGTLVLDQNTSGNFTAIMGDGVPGGSGSSVSGSLVIADSTGSNTGNVTITNVQSYTGATTVEAGTLTLGVANAIASSSGVTLGTIGGGSFAELALGANNTVANLTFMAGNTTEVALNGYTLTVLADSSNSGVIHNNGGTVSFGGTFTNSGGYISDPSTQTFNNLTVTATGYIRAAAGDVYQITGNFLNASTQNSLWYTNLANLEFSTGTSTTHTLSVVSLDLGNTLPTAHGAFGWAVLTIDAGNTLSLADGLGTDNEALYVNDLIGAVIAGDTITNIDGNGFNIYYDPYDTATAYLNGQNYALENGGELIADVPEPASLAGLLAGIVGLIAARRRTRRG